MNYDFIQIWLSNICILICSVFSTLYFFNCFFEKQGQKRTYDLCLMCAISVCYLFSLQFIDNQALKILIFLGCTYVISLQYKTNWYKRILYTLIFYLISLFFEIVISFLLIGVFKVGFSDLGQYVFVFARILLSRFVIFVFFAIFRLKNHHFLFSNNIRNWSTVVLLSSTSLIFIFGQINFIRNQNESDFQQILIILNLIFLIYCNHYVFKFVYTIWKSAESERKLVVANNLLSEQERQYSILFSNHNEIAKMHHDYKNILLGIQADLISKQYDVAMKHLQDKISSVSFSDKTICGNQIIDTIINNKISTAKSYNISIDFQYRNLQQLQIDSIDIAILLGNALDNAIEATSKLTDNQTKSILLMIILKGNDLNIIVKNPVEKDLNTDHLFSEKKDKRFHGYGIINMRTIVDRYGGSLIFTCQNREFRTTIILPNKTSSSISINQLNI